MTLDLKNYPPLPRFCTNDPADTKQYVDVFELVESVRVNRLGEIAMIQDDGVTFDKVIASSQFTPERLIRLKQLIEEKTFLHFAYGTNVLLIAIPNEEEAIERNKRDFLYTLLLILSMTGKEIHIGIRDIYDYDK